MLRNKSARPAAGNSARSFPALQRMTTEKGSGPELVGDANCGRAGGARTKRPDVWRRGCYVRAESQGDLASISPGFLASILTSLARCLMSG